MTTDDIIRVAEVRVAIAACRFLEEGSTQEAKQAANVKRRRLYNQLDGCRKTLDKLQSEAEVAGQNTGELERLREEVEDLAATLVIKPVQSSGTWAVVQSIDLIWRATATFLFVIFLGFVVSVPLIILTMVEQQLFLLLRGNRDSHSTSSNSSSSSSSSSDCSTPVPSPTNSESKSSQTAKETETDTGKGAKGTALAGDGAAAYCFGFVGISSLIKRLDAQWVLLIMGVKVHVEGLKECRGQSGPAMLLFSHASSLDAMIVLGTFPRAFCAVVKEELFAIPIIGWIMASHGGVPINRRHRASAVLALAATTDRARELDISVAMAPEGTRSKTGQLGPFKKGALHMQEQLRWPVIPITIRGASELFPLKAFFNQCGWVVVRFHKPIPAAEIKSRDGLAEKLRKEMLHALETETPMAGSALSLSRRAAGLAATALTYWAAARSWKILTEFSRRHEGVSVWALVAGGLAYVALSTLFVYFVYARKCFSSGGRGHGKWTGVRGGGAREEGVSPELATLLGGGGGGRGGDNGVTLTSTTLREKYR